MKYIAFYKPFNILSQFTDESGNLGLSHFNLPKEVYAAGRLDKDSEGLLILTNDGKFNKKLTDPKLKEWKTYWVQVDGAPTNSDLSKLEVGVKIKDYVTKPAKVKILDDQKPFPEREPPVRFRQNIPTTWIEISIREGKNRQVRRMTAKIGFPTLRLVRVKIGKLSLLDLDIGPGQFLEIEPDQVKLL